MSLSGAHGLVRIAGNPECELQTAMVIERVSEPEFYRRMTGEDYPREYGERTSARRRGQMFEDNLNANNAALLRKSVAPLFGYNPDEIIVRNMTDEVPGLTLQVRAKRRARTLKVIGDTLARKSITHLIIQPQLMLRVAPGAEDFFYVGPDFLFFDPSKLMYVPGEEKSFIVRDNFADAPDLGHTRLQGAAEILAVRQEVQPWLLSESVDERCVFVLGTPYGLSPHPAFVERLPAELTQIGRAIKAAVGVLERINAVRRKRGQTVLENMADELGVSFRESCVGSCVMADICKRNIASTAAIVGDAAHELLGDQLSIERIIDLLHGDSPETEREQELRDPLLDAASALGIGLRKRRAAR